MALEHPGTLAGRLVTLEPLSYEHREGLSEAVRDGELWNAWYTNVPRPEGMEAEIERRLELQRKGSMLPFTARRNDTGAIIGMTTFGESAPAAALFEEFGFTLENLLETAAELLDV